MSKRLTALFLGIILLAIALFGAHSRVGKAAESLTPRAYLPAVVAEKPPAISALDTHSYFYDDRDRLYVVGEIRNNRDEILSAITVYVDLLDAEGNAIDTGSDPDMRLEDLPPGDKQCFRVEFADPPAWDRYNVRTLASIGGDPLLEYTVLESEGIQTHPDEYKVTGRIRNDDPADVINPWVPGTLYASDGTVLDCTGDWLVGVTELPSGASAPFEAFFFGGSYNDVASYRIQLGGARESK